MKRAVALAMLACAGVMRTAIAQDFDAHGYVDCRLIVRADERSWTDGGLGKTRFGGSGISPACVQGGIVASEQLTPALLALADLQYQTTDRNALSLLEAWLRYRPVSTTPWRWSVKLGEFFPPISLENGLYLASEEVLLAHIRAAADEVPTVLLIGHNDGIGQLAADLADSGPPEALAAMRAKFPTGALAVLHVPDGPWSDLKPGTGKLLAFVRPRDLAVT